MGLLDCIAVGMIAGIALVGLTVGLVGLAVGLTVGLVGLAVGLR